MNIAQAVVLGVVEGLTEFLPVSSTGHLTVAERLLGLRVDDDAVTGFTAVIQVGAILAVVHYFRRDILSLVRAAAVGALHRDRRTDEFRFAMCVAAGSVPIGVVGLAARPIIEGPLRNLWVVAVALIAWSAAMVHAERTGNQRRGDRDLTIRDAVTIGLVQCLALVPGVSRSGATISAGLWAGVDRVSATRLSFLLAIPALLAAGVLQLPDALGSGAGLVPTLVGTVVSFLVAYATVAWLLRFVARHPITKFVGYRVVAGVLLAVLLGTGALESR